MTNPSPHPSGRLVHVFVSHSIPEGLLARGLLESEGVPVFMKGESEGPYRIGPVYLWVPQEFEPQAVALLAEVRAGGRVVVDEPDASRVSPAGQ